MVLQKTFNKAFKCMGSANDSNKLGESHKIAVHSG